MCAFHCFTLVRLPEGTHLALRFGVWRRGERGPGSGGAKSIETWSAREPCCGVDAFIRNIMVVGKTRSGMRNAADAFEARVYAMDLQDVRVPRFVFERSHDSANPRRHRCRARVSVGEMHRIEQTTVPEPEPAPDPAGSRLPFSPGAPVQTGSGATVRQRKPRGCATGSGAASLQKVPWPCKRQSELDRAIGLLDRLGFALARRSG
jgi:hypothetical protein